MLPSRSARDIARDIAHLTGRKDVNPAPCTLAKRAPQVALPILQPYRALSDSLYPPSTTRSYHPVHRQQSSNMGKVHGSLARAGKVKSATPKASAS